MHVGGGLGVDQLRQDLGEASVQVSVHIRKTQVLDEASSAGSGSAIACAGLVRAGRGAGTGGCRADRSCWILGCFHGSWALQGLCEGHLKNKKLHFEKFQMYQRVQKKCI